MKNYMKSFYALLLLFLALMYGCSSPKEDGGPVAEQANNNASLPTPQSGTPVAQSVPVAPAAQAPTPVVQPAVNPNEKAVAVQPNAQPAAGQKAPRLVVPTKQIDFGSQERNKTITRAFVVKNAGKAELRLDSVEPS